MTQGKVSPWLRGIIDTLVGAEIIRRSVIPHRNRLAVILIDSAFETGCRAYLRHKARIKLQDNHQHRDNLVSTVKAKLTHIDDEVWDNISFYYTEVRCDFYHQSAAKTIIDVDLLDYRDTVAFVLDEAFDINIARLVAAELAKVEEGKSGQDSSEERVTVPRVTQVHGRMNKVLVAVASLEPKEVEAVNAYFKKEGEALRLKKREFTNIIGRNRGSKKFFCYDRERRQWTLSELGRFKLKQIQSEVSNVE